MRNETCVSVISTMCITWTPLPSLTSLTLISSSIYSLFIVKHLATQCASSADSFIHSFAVAVAVAAATSTTVLTLITYVAFSYVYHTYTHTDCLSLAHFPSWHRTLPFFFFSFLFAHAILPVPLISASLIIVVIRVVKKNLLLSPSICAG